MFCSFIAKVLGNIMTLKLAKKSGSAEVSHPARIALLRHPISPKVLTLSLLPVTRWVGHNTDLPSNSNISRKR